MTVPYTFGTATTSIPLSNLDANFNTPITLGNTSIYLGNTTTTIGNLTLTNATISGGNVTITNVSVTTANVTTGNITTLTSTSITDSGLTSGRVTYAGASGLLSDSANLTFDGTNLTTGGSETAARFIPSGSSIPTNGMFLPAANTLGFSTNTTRQMTISSLGYVGIGVSSPTQSLQIGNATSVEIDNLIAGTRTSTFYTDNSQFIIETATNINMIFNTNATQRMVITGGGNVLVGTTSAVDSSKVQISGAKVLSSGIPQGQLNILDSSAMAASVGGAIAFSAQYQSGLYTTMGSVEGIKENATAGQYGGSLVFRTRTNFGDNNERMRIDSSGNLLVGTTTQPSASGVGGIKVNGAVAFGQSSATNSTTYTVGNDDYWITLYALPGTATVTLPSAGTSTGRQLYFRTQSAQAVISASNNVTALATGSLGNGILPATQGAWALLISDGTYWNIVASN